MSPITLADSPFIGYNMLMPAKDDTNDEAQWSYQPEDRPEPLENTGRSSSDERPGRSISWTASEFIDVHKGAGWHILFFAGILLLSALVLIITHDYISSVTITIAAVIFVVLTRKKPQQLPYEINSQGVQIGGRFYNYGAFKSFGLGQEIGVKSINFMPLKRFMPEISIYFPPEQEKEIVSILSDHLPHEDYAEKTVDKLAKKLRF